MPFFLLALAAVGAFVLLTRSSVGSHTYKGWPYSISQASDTEFDWMVYTPGTLSPAPGSSHMVSYTSAAAAEAGARLWIDHQPKAA